MNPLVLKWLGIGLIGLSLLLFGFGLGQRFEKTSWLEKELARVEAEKEQAIKDTEARLQAGIDYNAKVRDLEDSYRNRPPRVVRVCDATSSVSGSTGVADGAPAGGVQGAHGPDIGQRLYDLAQDADKCALQLRELQAWVKTVATTQDR
jgi:hypothetical protein